MARRRSHSIKRDLCSDSMGSNIFSMHDLESEHNGLNGEFLLYQVIVKHLLSQSLVNSSSKKKLSEHFKVDNEKDREILVEFDKNYKSSKAIYWYTRESCVYRLLNKALRTHNIADLIVFNDFIRDLYDQLAYEQVLLLITNPTNKLKVYRGQFISIDELNRIKTGKGQLISMNSFLSTSTNKNKALQFINQKSNSDLFSTILLEINLNLKSSSKPYADVKHLSAFAEEEEILFMFGAIFRIDHVEKDKQFHHWNIKLTLCDNEDADLTKFEKIFEQELKGKNLLVCLGHYMMQIQKFDEAEVHYEILLDNQLIDNEFDLATCYFGIAQVNQKKGEFDYAIQNFNLAIKYLIENPKTIDHYLLPQAYNYLASIYTEQYNHTLAFQYYEKALAFKTNNHFVTHQGIAKLHFHMENYQIALEYLFKSIEKPSNINSSHLPKIFIEIGKIYGILKESRKALQFFEKAIRYQEKRLSSNHPDVGYTYIAMALNFHEYGQENKAFQYIEKAYQLQLNSLPRNHLDFCETFKTFGIFYQKKSLFDKALNYFFQLLDNQTKILSWKHPDVAQTYSIIAHTYLQKKDFDNALIYFSKLLKSQIQRIPSGNTKLSETYETIAKIYFDKNDIDQSLIYHHKFLDNELQRININDPLLDNIYQTLSNIYLKKQDYSQALIYLNRLIDTQLNNKNLDENIINQTYSIIGKIYLNNYSFNHSLLYFNNQLDIKLSDDNILPNYFQIIQDKHFEKRHLDQVLIYFQYLLNKQLKTLEDGNQSLSNTFQILANIYLEKQDFDQALIYLEKLLNNQLKEKTISQLSLINTNYLIANIYFKKENFNQSLKYFQKILKYQLNNQVMLFIAISFFQLADFIQSIDYFNQLMDFKTIDQKLLIEVYHFIGKIFLKTNLFSQYSSSIHYQTSHISLPKSYQINKLTQNNQSQQRHLDNIILYFQQLIGDQPESFVLKTFSLNDLYKIIAKIYLEKQDLNQSLIYFCKYVDNQLKLNLTDDLSLIEIYKIISIIYYEIKDFDQSLIYLENLFNFQLEISSLSDLYKTMAIIYFKKDEYSKSFTYLNKSLDLIQQLKPINQKEIKSIYHFIKEILLKINYFNQNLFFYNEDIDEFSLLNLKDIDQNLVLEKQYLDQTLNYYLNQKVKNKSLNKIYKIIAILNLNKTNFDELFIYLNKYLNYQLKVNLLDDFRLTYIYQIIGLIYFNKRYLKQSLTYLYRYFNCQLKNNLLTIESYSFIGKIFSKLFLFPNSNETDRFKQQLSDNTFQSINDIHFQNSQKDQLLNYFLQLLNQNLSNKNDIFLIIANIYFEKSDYDNSLFYLIKSMENHIQPNLILGDTYFNMGVVYFKKGLFNQALKDYKTALKIYNKIYPSNHYKINQLKLAIFQIINKELD